MDINKFKLTVNGIPITGYKSLELIAIPKTPHPLEDRHTYVIKATYPDGEIRSYESDRFNALFDEGYQLYEFSLLSPTE